MIRVLHIVTTLDRGGIETMLMNYYRHIDRTSVQFDFLKHTKESCDYEEEIHSLGGKIYSVPALNPFSVSYRRALDDFFSRHGEYRIVHAHLDCMSPLPLCYARKNRVEVRIAHAHNTDQEHNLKYPIKMYYRSRMAFAATDLFACGKKAGRWMYGGKPFYVMKNAVDTDTYLYNRDHREKIRRELGVENAFLVGHVGRFFEQKNHLFLVEVFREIAERMPGARLLLIGTGPLEHAVREKVRGYGLDQKVIFYGLSEKVEQMLSAMDVFVMPSLYEGLPVTMIEAQTSGLRCVVSHTITEEAVLTNNVCPLKLQAGAGCWAEKILSFGRGYERKNMKEAVVRKGFDIRENCKRIEEYYHRKSH